jgi:hypothetical protein
VVDGRFDPRHGGAGLRARLDKICAEVSDAIADGARLIILSDRMPPAEPGDRFPRDNMVPIPSLLLTGAVHHHLIKRKSRTQVGLIVEAADVRECHHVALLIGYGAAAVNPYLAVESVRDLVRRDIIAFDPKAPDKPRLTEKKAEANLLKALGKGLLKIMSKMGVSTVASYTGAQIFEAIGLGPEVISTCFAGTTSRLSGVGFDALAEETELRTHHAIGAGAGMAYRRLDTGGEYQWRRGGEPHLFSPETVFKLQHATRSRKYEIFKEYTTLVDDQSRRLMTLRGLLRIRGVDFPAPAPVPEKGKQGDQVAEPQPVHCRRRRARHQPVRKVRHRSHVLRVDLGGGPPDPRHRDEPAGRAVEHRGGRRGRRPVPARRQRRPAALSGQAGGERPVRRHQRVPGQRRRPADQDGPGSQAGRGRPAAW